jgi:hypothetical protein
MPDTFVAGTGVEVSRVPVTTAATRIIRGQGQYLLKNATATEAVFLGPAGVTLATGFSWLKADEGTIAVELREGMELWGIITTATQTIHTIRLRGVSAS